MTWSSKGDTPKVLLFRNQTPALCDELLNNELYITYFTSNKNEKVTYNDYNLMQVNAMLHCEELTASIKIKHRPSLTAKIFQLQESLNTKHHSNRSKISYSLTM